MRKLEVFPTVVHLKHEAICTRTDHWYQTITKSQSLISWAWFPRIRHKKTPKRRKIVNRTVLLRPKPPFGDTPIRPLVRRKIFSDVAFEIIETPSHQLLFFSFSASVFQPSISAGTWGTFSGTGGACFSSALIAGCLSSELAISTAPGCGWLYCGADPGAGGG